MALEVNAPASVSKNEVKVVATDITRVNGTYFDFDNTTAIALVSFGTGDPFEAMGKEMWLLSGDYYVNAISVTPQGSTSAEVLLTAVGTVVATIQATPGLKDQLIESGELKVSQGTIFDFLK